MSHELIATLMKDPQCREILTHALTRAMALKMTGQDLLKEDASDEAIENAKAGFDPKSGFNFRRLAAVMMYKLVGPGVKFQINDDILADMPSELYLEVTHSDKNKTITLKAMTQGQYDDEPQEKKDAARLIRDGGDEE